MTFHNFFRLTVVVLLLLVLLPAFAHADDDDPHCRAHEDMDKLQNTDQRSLGMCNEEIFEARDEEMNKLYKQKISALHSEQYKKLLRDAQRAWIVYRDKVCGYEVSGLEGLRGAYALMLGDCKARITEQRIEDLKDYLACTPDTNSMCPD